MERHDAGSSFLKKYADTVTSKGAPLYNCFGFIDGTVRPVCWPGERQMVLYNGHKRVHALKFQMVALPSGIIASMYGPVGNVFISIGNCCVVLWRIRKAILSFCFFVYTKKKINIAEGKKHDAGMLAESGLLADLQQNGFSPTGQPMCLYGDPAYPLRLHLQGPFRNARRTPQMEDFNAAMSAVRTSVEWMFGDIVNKFKFLDFKKNLKVGLSPVGKMYIVSAILHNGITCMYGNQVSDFFALDPPSLQEYFV